MYVSSSSFMYLRISCYCDACLNSSDLRVGVTTLLNTIQCYHIIPVHSKAVSILPSGAKKWQSSARLFCRFGHHFALVGKIDTNSPICECRCILCPNVENVCPNNGQFFSVGVATTSPASPCRTLMVRFTTSEMCVKNNIHLYVSRTSRNRIGTTCDLHVATM